MRRTRRHVAAWVVILGLVTAQLTALAHACPLIEAALPAPTNSVQIVEPCAGMDTNRVVDVTAPCVEHCNFGSQASHTTGADQPAHAPFVFLVVDVQAPPPTAELRVESLLARTTAPPVFAVSSRLRI